MRKEKDLSNLRTNRKNAVKKDLCRSMTNQRSTSLKNVGPNKAEKPSPTDFTGKTLKALKGKLQIEDNWEKLRSMELQEVHSYSRKRTR